MDKKKSVKKIIAITAVLTALSACASTGQISRQDQPLIRRHISQKFNPETLASDKVLKKEVNNGLKHAKKVLIWLEKGDPWINSMLDYIRAGGEGLKARNIEAVEKEIEALEGNLAILQKRGIDMRTEIAELEEIKSDLKDID